MKLLDKALSLKSEIENFKKTGKPATSVCADHSGIIIEKHLFDSVSNDEWMRMAKERLTSSLSKDIMTLPIPADFELRLEMLLKETNHHKEFSRFIKKIKVKELTYQNALDVLNLLIPALQEQA